MCEGRSVLDWRHFEANHRGKSVPSHSIVRFGTLKLICRGGMESSNALYHERLENAARWVTVITKRGHFADHKPEFCPS